MNQPPQCVNIDELGSCASEIADEMRAGHTLELIQGGECIAEIVSCTGKKMDPEREAAWGEMKAILKTGMDLGGVPFSYDERHDR